MPAAKTQVIQSKPRAKVFEVEEKDTNENEPVLHNIIPFNFIANYLFEKLQVQETFVVGGKVTEVSIS